MAATKYGKITCTTTAQSIGDDSPSVQEFIFQVPTGGSTVYIAFNGDTAVADKGLFIEAGQTLSSKTLPDFVKQGQFSVIVASGTGAFYYTFSKARGA